MELSKMELSESRETSRNFKLEKDSFVSYF